MPHPQLGAASHPQLGATSQPQLGAAKQPRRPLNRLFSPPKILQRGAHESQLGAAISHPQLGAAAPQPQLGAGAAQPPQLGAAISQPQLGATSQPQLGALRHEPKLLSLPRSLLNRPGRPQGSQLGATSQPQLGAATSQPQLGAESQQPPNRPALAVDGANRPAMANRARKRTDILVSPKVGTYIGLVLAAALAEQAIPTTVGLIKVGLIADVIALAGEQVTSPSSFDRFIASSLRKPHYLPN